VLIYKYNRFVDGIFGRINKILKKSYDPVSVRLSPSGSAKHNIKSPSKKHGHKSSSKKNKRHGSSKNSSKQSDSRDNATGKNVTEAPMDIDPVTISSTISIFDAEVLSKLSAALATDMSSPLKDNIDIITDDQGVRHELIASSSSTITRRVRRDAEGEAEPAEPEATNSVSKIDEIPVAISEDQPATETPVTEKAPDRRRSVSSHKRNSSHSSKSSHHRKSSSKRQPLTKQASGQKKTRARGILYGLSTLRRQGNVRVNVMGEYTTVKSNFVLGPLVLKVEKAFGRGSKRELKSATATTTQMIGRISLRIINGTATLHSIKVQQPKQVQVDSVDNHDRTREFVWQKSSHIAQVVSQKLTSAARSMLQKPPKPN